MTTKPLRVLLASGVYPPEIGGPSRQTYEIAGALARSGVHVEVLVSGRSAEVAAGPDERGIHIHRLHGGARDVPAWKRLLERGETFRQIAGVLRAVRPDVVHVQAPYGFMFYVALVARRMGIPVLTKFAGSHVTENLSNRRDVVPGAPQESASAGDELIPSSLPLAARLTQRLERACLQLSGCVWTTTPTYARMLETRYRTPPEKLWVYPNMIDLAAFERVGEQRDEEGSPLSTLPRLTIVSRLKIHKGIHVAVEALAQLRGSEARLEIYGDGPEAYLDHLREQIDILGLGERAFLHGAIPTQQVQDAYRSADVILMPSFVEPFGIVLVEAMAAGVPIVASRVGGIPDVVEDGVSGLLVPPDDAEALASAIRRVLTDDALRARLVVAGRAQAQSYALDAGVEVLVERYRALAKA